MDENNTFSNTDSMMKWPNTLQFLMDKHGETQEHLAEAVDCSQGLIASYLSKVKPKYPRMKMLKRLAEHFNVEVDQLFSMNEGNSTSSTIEETSKQTKHSAKKIPIQPRTIPFLENHEIIPWVKHGVLPPNHRSISVPLPHDFKLTVKAFLYDITDELACSHLFPIRIPGLGVYAIVEPPHSAQVGDIVIASGKDVAPKIYQCVKSGGELSLKSFEPQSTLIKFKTVDFLGKVETFHHLPFDSAPSLGDG